jgi:hypothetical protein
MRWLKWLPLALLGAVAACAPKLTPQQAAVQQQVIEGRLKTWEQGMMSLKPDSMGLVYEHDAGLDVAWPDGKRSHGWQQEEQAQKDFADGTKAFNFDVQDAVTEVLSTTVAVTTFRHASDVTDASGRALYSGLGTVVWVKDPNDKMWYIHALQLSRNPAEQPAGLRR